MSDKPKPALDLDALELAVELCSGGGAWGPDTVSALIARVREAEAERDELRAKIAAVRAELARHDDISDKSAGRLFLKEALEAETRTEVVISVRRALGDA